MLKLIGVALTVVTGALVGIRASEKLRQRCRKLNEYYIFIGEISDGIRMGAELERIFSQPKASALFDAEGYNISVKEQWLNGEDTRLLEEFVELLGMGDTKAQILRCSTYRELVKKRAFEAEENMKSKSRLYSILGLFSGLFAAIIFI